MQKRLRVFIESFVMAAFALTANRLRTMLSLLGITIGIFAIISVFTVVDSLERNIRGSVESLGDNIVFVQKWPWSFGSDYPWWKYMNRPHPDIKEWQAISRRTEMGASASYAANYITNAFNKSRVVENIQVMAITKGYDQVFNLNIASGRFFTAAEFDRGVKYCVLGDDVAYALFRNSAAIGKRIKVGDFFFEVIGVLAREGETVFGNSSDVLILIPEMAARTMFDTKSDRADPRIMVRAKPGVSVADLKQELTQIMRAERKLKPRAEENFALNETSILSKGFSDFFGFIQVVGGIIGIFSVLVGGFGIANIMFVSVKERTNLIGIQRALGAQKWFILIQFLFESVLLCLLGGGVGLLLIFGLTQMSLMGSFELILSLKNVGLGLGISVVIGLIAGVVPAYTAAQLDPVEAIRQ